MIIQFRSGDERSGDGRYGPGERGDIAGLPLLQPAPTRPTHGRILHETNALLSPLQSGLQRKTQATSHGQR